MKTRQASNLQLRLLTNVVIVYMLMAFAWWSVLLFTKNRDAFEAKAEVMRISMAAQRLVQNEAEFRQTPPYLELTRKYKRQEWMIMGEAIVFVISLVIGVYMINRGYLREVNAARQRRNFLLSITHELKSPLASIRLVMDTLRKRELTQDQIKQLSRNGLKETERLHALVEDLLLSAKLETAYQPHLEITDLSRLLQDCLQRVQDKNPDRPMIWNGPAEPVEIAVDRTGMTSVVLNLLENAVKYSPEDSPVQLQLQANEKNVQILVADVGIGIPDQEKKQVFEKFYRVGNEDTRQTKGTGLGLYIVEQIVRAHGGLIQIRDNQPQGTIFDLTLPCTTEKIP